MGDMLCGGACLRSAYGGIDQYLTRVVDAQPPYANALVRGLCRVGYPHHVVLDLLAAIVFDRAVREVDPLDSSDVNCRPFRSRRNGV